MKATKYIFFAVTMFVSAIFVMAALLMAFDSASAALPLQLPVNIHSLEPIGQIGGSFKALVAQDEYVYAAIGPRLAVLDVSDATHPTLTGQTSILSIDIQALAIQGNVAYAAAGADGLSIFDVSNPSQPVELGNVDMPGFATSVVITGSHAFVTTDIDLQVVDVLQPNTPLIVGSYPGMASDIVFSGNTMFIAVEDKISLIDISDPENLSLVLNYDVPADEIEIAGNVLYVGKLSSVPGPAGAIYYGTLRILDISGLPTITETFFSGDEYPGTVPSQLRDMKLLDHQLYGYGTYCGHATGPCSLEFGGMDVSDPISPTMDYTSIYGVTRYDWYWGDFTVDNQRVYMAVKDTLHIFDAVTSLEVGQYSSWTADQVSVENGVAYVAARSAGLLSVDVAAPELPILLDAYTTTSEGSGTQPALISKMTAYGPYIYAQVVSSGLGPGRVDILDVSNSGNIERAATGEWHMLPERIHNGYGYYFYSDMGTELRAIDLGNPAQPSNVSGHLATTISGPRLSLAGHYAYVAGTYEGLHVINIANPQNFVDVKRLAGPIPALLQEGAEDLLYIFTDQALKFYNVSDPENPVEISDTALTNLAGLTAMKVSHGDIFLIQNELYVFPNTATVRVFHIDDISSQVDEVAYYTRPGGFFKSIDVIGDLVYIASADDGLLILRHVVSNPAMSETIYLPIIDAQVYSPPADCEIYYRTYMQDNGWLDWAHDGSTAGLAGQGLRVEALQVNLCQNPPQTMGIAYQAHIQEIGWMNWVYNDQIVGTIGENKRLEAVRFKLLNAPSGYHITYRVYIEGSGWSGLLSDGEMAGTTGQGKRIEAIQINLIQP